MMEIEKLRKADMFSGAAVVILGLCVVGGALQMPMKDSYGGVQNVWYVSSALFPLLVGGMLVFLGGLLMKTALKVTGIQGCKSVVRYLTSRQLLDYLKRAETIRFYGIVLNLIILVFLLVPRVDFFIAAIAFLFIFFLMFYCSGDLLVQALIYRMIIGGGILFFFFATPLSRWISSLLPFAGDWLSIVVFSSIIYTSYQKLKGHADRIKKFRLSCIIAVAAPFIIGIIFKYFLLVPMPFEGIVVSVLDAIWYAEFWS